LTTILVTGGAGYIGSHAVLALRDAGFEVVVLDNLSTGFREAVPEGVPLVEGSVLETGLVNEALRRHGASAVLHFAGSLVVPESLEQPLRYWENNLAGTLSVLRACEAAGVRQLVFSSTAAVYGMPASGLVDEDVPPCPINPYGASKAAAERLVADAAGPLGLRSVVLRYFNVAGADPAGRAGQRTARATHLLKVVCEVAVGQRAEVQVFGTDYPTPDGTGVRDFIHVSDLAEAHVAALRHLLRGGGSLTLNCGYGTGHSVRDVLAAVERVSGRSLAVRNLPRRAGDAPVLVARAERIRTALGWQPRLEGLDGIVASALAWERRMQAERLESAA